MSLISDADYDFVRSLYPNLEMKPLPSQYEHAIFLHLRGASMKTAANGAGVRYDTLAAILRREEVKALLQHLREREFADIRITRESITEMYLNAYKLAGSAGEMVAATRELAKLHRLYPEQTGPTSTNVQVNVMSGAEGAATVEIANEKKLQQLSDAELLKLAPQITELLEPPQVIEGEVIVEED